MDERSVLKYFLIKTELKQKMQESEWFQKVNDDFKDACVTHIYFRLIQKTIFRLIQKNIWKILDGPTTIQEIV